MTIMTLGAVAEYINGRAFKPEEWEETGKPIIRIQNLTNSSTICNRTNKTYEEKYLVSDGDLLFAWSASLGAHIWHGEDGWLNQHIFKVLPYPCVTKMFLYYYLLYVVDQLYSKTHGSGMVHITLKPFKETRIIVPTIKAQNCLVSRIESLFAKLDEAKEKAQTVVDGFKDWKAAILHKAFTGELTKKQRINKGVEYESWESVTLKDIVSGFKYGTSEKSDYSFLGMPVLRIPNIGENEIDFTDIKNLSCKIVEDANQVHENDILIIRSNGSRDLVGKCALVPQLDREYAYASFLIRIKPSERVAPNFLVLFLNSADARTQMFAKAKSSAGINNINSKELGAIIMKLPEKWEQEEIVLQVSKLILLEKQANEAAKQVLDQIDSMKKTILSRAFRSELSTNDPTDESAEELLKKIL